MAAYQPLQPWSWLIVPTLVCLFGTVIVAAPARFLGLALPEPVFPMVLAFAWAVIRPSVMGPFLLLLTGLFLDLFWHGTLGLWALCLILVYGVALLVRNLMVGQSVRVLWVWYGVFTTLAFIVAYLVVVARAHATPNLINAVWQAGVTILLFPFARRLIEQFEDADIRFR
jgi:rod shape-determining protein MreD